MERVITINPLDGDDRSALNKFFADGWFTYFQFLLKTEDGTVLLYYHLCHEDEEQSDHQCDHDELTRDEYEGSGQEPDDEEDPDNWRVH